MTIHQSGDAFDLLTLTRAGGGMRTNRNALLEWMGNNVPRMDYDPITLAPRGILLEGGRTNVLTRSQEFDNAAWTKTRATIVPDAAVAPDGTMTADKLVEDTTAANSHFTMFPFTPLGNTTYAYSVFLKAAERARAVVQIGNFVNLVDANPVTVELSDGSFSATNGARAWVRKFRNDWWRVTTVSTTVASPVGSIQPHVILRDAGASSAYDGDGTSGLYIWGAQLEVGAFPSSYIPTTTAAVARASDVCSIPVTDFPFNPAEGTLIAEASIDRQSSASIEIANLFDGTNNNRIRLGISPSNLSNTLIVAGGTTQFNHTGTSPAPGAIRKMAVAFKANDAASVVDGAIIGTSSSVVMPIVTTLRLGGGSDLFGHVRKLLYFPRRLSNAELQARTA